MKQYSTLIAMSLAAVACSRNDMNERDAKQRVEDNFEAQNEQLAAQHEAEREALKRTQEREEKILEQDQKQQERNVEQRYDALKAGEPKVGDPKAASAMTAGAVTDIATARCAREQKCGNIGADKTYPSMEFCTTKLSDELQEELNAYDCEKGVVAKELEECLAAIRDEACNAPFDKLARIAACRDSDICNN